MGIEKDYLMRQLLMLFEVIRKILAYRKQGEEEKAIEEIQYFYSCLKIEKDLELMDIEELLRFLEEDKQLTNEHIEMVAFVMKEQGELSEEQYRRINFFNKAFFILNKVEHESTSFSMERQMKLAELKSHLK